VTAIAALLAAYAAGYAVLAHALWRRRGVVRPLRAAAFALGLLAVGVALASPLDARAQDGSLLAHMVQHELLLNVAPVLLLLGLDAQLASPLSRAVGGTVARRRRGLRALGVLGAPALALALYVGVVAAWHVPAAYAAAAGSELLHPLEHASLFWVGVLFWFHLLRPLPSVRRLTPTGQAGYLLLGTLGGAGLAALLVGAPVSLYPASVSAGLGDQRLAGGLMMAVEMPLALGVGYAVLLRGVLRRRHRTGPAWLGT
jgi:cytochrome c oxidase assembly factor CtaG